MLVSEGPQAICKHQCFTDAALAFAPAPARTTLSMPGIGKFWIAFPASLSTAASRMLRKLATAGIDRVSRIAGHSLVAGQFASSAVPAYALTPCAAGLLKQSDATDMIMVLVRR